MNVAFVNLGCKVNKYECDALAVALLRQGHCVSEGLAFADIYVLNTCAVTNEAERKSRQAVARCLAKNGAAKIIVMGCASQKSPQSFSEKSGVIYVSGTAGRDKIIDFIGGLTAAVASENGNTVAGAATSKNSSPTTSKVRAFIKIQDGCDNRCSYCVIPYLRGGARSKPLAEIAAECEAAVAAGFKELVLTGINLTAYGHGANALPQVIEALKHLDVRIRLSSLEVPKAGAELLGALKGLKHFCPHFHLSLQSGADATLRAMNRHYVGAEFLRVTEEIRAAFPGAAVTTDLIVGFPSESEADFEESLAFCQKACFSDMHVFPYSRRGGTAADKAYARDIDPKTVKARVARAEEIRDKMRADYMRKFLDKPLEILVEREKNGVLEGHSKNYLKCRFTSSISAKVGDIIAARMTGIEGAVLTNK